MVGRRSHAIEREQVGSPQDTPEVVVREAAYRAARAILADDVSAEIAGDHAVDAFMRVSSAGESINSLTSWARRVGRNFALSCKRRRCRKAAFVDVELLSAGVHRHSAVDFNAVMIVLRQHPEVRLTRKQRHVVEVLDPCDTIKGNARSIGMAPFALRRMLRTIGRRAAGLRESLLPTA
ncbi:MAG: hypothetical protein AB7T19_03745 [Planctomycetota bacterium]